MDEEAVLSEQELQAEPEKTLPVSRVNEIVKREKGIAAEKVRKELEAQYSQELAHARSQSPKPVQDDMTSLEDRVVNRLMAEAKKHEDAEAKRYHEEQERLQLEEANKLVQKYSSKMAQGKEFFDDFEETMGDFSPQAFPQLVYLAAQEENTPAIMYELAKNPLKLASLQKLAEMHPALAEKEMKKLALSISQNHQAVQGNVSAPQPLSRLKSSKSTGVDSGKMSVADFKNADWLRPTR
jgi:hypothetical protein